MLAINLSEMWPCMFGRYTNIIAAQIHLQCVSIKPSSQIKVTFSFLNKAFHCRILWNKRITFTFMDSKYFLSYIFSSVKFWVSINKDVIKMWNMGIDCGKFGFGIWLLPGPEIDSDGDCIVTACLSQVLSDIWAISVIKWKMCSFFVRASDPLPFFVFNYLVILFIRTPVVPLRNYRISAIKKPNQMANRTLNFEAGNGNRWRRCNHKRKLLIAGSEHTFI